MGSGRVREVVSTYKKVSTTPHNTRINNDKIEGKDKLKEMTKNRTKKLKK